MGGHAYVTGVTGSTGFPTKDAIEPALAAHDSDAFVTKLTSDGSALAYSTYLGGQEFTTGVGIAVDFAGNAYVVTSGPWTGPPSAGAAVTKLNARGTARVYTTYCHALFGQAIAVDASGRAYVAGQQPWSDFPTKDGLPIDEGDGFLALLDPTGSTFVYATHLPRAATGVAVDEAGDAYVAGIGGRANDSGGVVTKIALSGEGACARPRPDCGLYRCERGMCPTRCESNDGCLAPAECLADHCEIAPDYVFDDLGGGCSTTGALGARARRP